MRSLLSISQQFIINEDNLLGKGSTGNVYLGFEASNQHKKYAVKAIDLSKVTNPVTQYLLSCQIVALTDLSKQHCKHIVKLQSQPIFHGQFLYLVMEILEGGSLADVIRQNYNGIQQPQTFKIFTQIIKAYRVIQQLGIVHRDIKPDNLIFRKKNQLNHSVISDNELCFIDFGYCLKQSVPNKPEGYYNVGSPKYMSPQAYKQSKYSQKSDIWAMGVILYEMLHGTTIDAGMNMEQYFDKMQHEGLVNRKGINRQIWQLLAGMLQFEVQRRMKLQEIERRIDWILNGGNISNEIRPADISQTPINIHVKSSQIISSSFNQSHRNIIFENEKRILTVPLQRVQTFNSFQGQNVPQIRLHNPQNSHSFNQSRPVNPNSQRQMINKKNDVSLSHQRNQNQHLSNSHIIQPNETIIPQQIVFPSHNSNLQSVQIKSPLHISERFIIDEDQLLGKGSTGNVYLGFQTQNLGKKYAVKAIDLSQVTNPVTQFLLSCEIVALKDLAEINCRHIVKLEDILFDQKYCYLVMQLLEGGSLADYIRYRSNGIDQNQALNLFKQMFQAYGVIRSLQIIHRDIKPDNLIFRRPKLQNNQTKIENQLCFIDFGYCLKQSVPNKPEGYYNVGSPKYMSPQAYKQSKYSQKSDIWAMGVILYEMLHGTTIDAGMNMEQYFDKMQHEGLVNRKGINRQIWDLLNSMLRFQTQDRQQYDEIRTRLQNIVIPLKDSMIVPSFQKDERKLYNSQFFVNQNLHPMQSSQYHQFLNHQSQQFNTMIPELKFKPIENPNLIMRHSQRSSTQPPNLFQRQLQPKSFTKSYIFPQQNHNQQILRRNPSAQIINQQVIIHRIPQKNYSSQKIVHASYLKNQYKSSPLQKIEQERLNQNNNMKRSMMDKQNSIQKLRKINFNDIHPQNINYERTKFIYQGQSQNLNNSFGSHHPGQYPIKNPYIKQLAHNIPVQRNDGFRQSVGVIRSENIILEQRVRDQQNELMNKEVKRQMSLKKLNQMQNNNVNTHQNISASIKPFQNQNNLRATISNNIPSNFHHNIISVQNVYQGQNQNNLNNNINILRDPSKIMNNENQDIHERSFNMDIHQRSFNINLHQRSFDMNNTKTAQKYFNNYPIMSNTTDNIYSHSNEKHSPLLMTNLPSHFVQYNPSSIGNNMPLNSHPVNTNINTNINKNTPEKLVINYGSQSIVRFPQSPNSQVKQLINVPTNMIESRFADHRSPHQNFRSQFGINSVQQSAQKVAHTTYFQMSKMDDNTILNEKDPKGNIRYHQSTVQPKFSNNQNVYLKKQLFHSQMNNNLNQSKIINPNETLSRFQHPNEAVSRFQPPKPYSQVINTHSQLNVQNHPFPVDPYKSHIIVENKNTHQIISHVQHNQPSNHYVSNNLQGQKLQVKSDSNFCPPNNNSQYHQKFVQKSFHPSQNLPFIVQNQRQTVPQGQLRRIPFTNNAQMLNKNIVIQNMNVKNGQIMPSPVQISSVPLQTSKIVVKELPRIVTQTRKMIIPFPHSQTLPMGRNIEGPLRRQVYNGDNRNNVQYFQVPTRDTNMHKMPNQNPNIRFQ